MCRSLENLCPVGIELPFVGPTMLGDVEQCWMKILNKIKPDPVSARITQHNVQTRPTINVASSNIGLCWTNMLALFERDFKAACKWLSA